MPAKGKGKNYAAREEQWNLGVSNAIWHGKREEYDALHDPNMRHFFENDKTQRHLYNIGLIDNTGRVIDQAKSATKLNIIMHEFKQAERLEYLRQREEEAMRVRVQKKRLEALEKMKRIENIRRIREDCKIRNEILAAIRSSQPVPKPAQPKKNGKKVQNQNSLITKKLNSGMPRNNVAGA